jgi:hypothetical protein
VPARKTPRATAVRILSLAKQNLIVLYDNNAYTNFWSLSGIHMTASILTTYPERDDTVNMEIHLTSTPKDWYQFLSDDTFEFSNTQIFLSPIISNAVQRHIKKEQHQKILHDLLNSQIKIAADRYLENFDDKVSYTFPTYFTWYMAEAINSFNIASPKNIFYK